MSAAMMRRLGPLALLALSGWACGEPRLLDSFSEGLTRIRLIPSEFIGSVPCRRGTSGALQFYSVRLQALDSRSDAGVVDAFTTGAVPCDQAVMFPSTAGRSYIAEIRGFDRVVTDAEVESVPPRWTASCGRGSESVPDAGLDPYRPTVSVRGLTVPMRGCTTFLEIAPGSVAGQLVVDQPSALGTLRCGQRTGEVARVEAALGGVTRSAACREPLVFDVAGPERYYTITLTGFEVGEDAGAALPDASEGGAPAPSPAPSGADAGAADAGEPLDASVGPSPAPGDAGTSPLPPLVGVARWRTQCVGRSLPGVVASAYCDPFQRLP
jgi:hypothetical protein